MADRLGRVGETRMQGWMESVRENQAWLTDCWVSEGRGAEVR
jgi:hypothetical protein